MRSIRIYTTLSPQKNQTLALNKQASSHIARVLRLKEGSEIVLFNGDGNNYRGIIAGIDKTVSVRIEDCEENPSESPLSITLLQGISRSEKMDFTLQKATELGVSTIQPVFCQRSVVQLKAERLEKKHRHWLAVIQSACEQCGRSTIPNLQGAMSLSDYFLQSSSTETTRLMLEPSATRSFSALSLTDNTCELLIGPEGGFSDEELAAASEAKFQALSLGPRVLRTETAGLASLAILQALHGDLN